MSRVPGTQITTIILKCSFGSMSSFPHVISLSNRSFDLRGGILFRHDRRAYVYRDYSA